MNRLRREKHRKKVYKHKADRLLVEVNLLCE